MGSVALDTDTANQKLIEGWQKRIGGGGGGGLWCLPLPSDSNTSCVPSDNGRYIYVLRANAK